ncbi:MAG: hypothetical protein AAF570_21650, partial [Bacteroidota bacterium]
MKCATIQTWVYSVHVGNVTIHPDSQVGAFRMFILRLQIGLCTVQIRARKPPCSPQRTFFNLPAYLALQRLHCYTLSLMLKQNLKLLSVALMAFLCCFQAKATHNVGVDMTYECVNSCTIRVHLRAYRDCYGAAVITNNMNFALAQGTCSSTPQ